MVEQRKSKERAGDIGRRAQELSGYEHLRPGQESALRAIYGGHDTLVIMPMGSGKSFIYQAAGNFIAGPTIVISPLIALQRDQAHMSIRWDTRLSRKKWWLKKICSRYCAAKAAFN